MTLASSGFERYAKTTRRAAFLAEVDRVVPWAGLCALIEPFYPKAGNGRPPKPIEQRLRIYFLQQWFDQRRHRGCHHHQCAELYEECLAEPRRGYASDEEG